jgi:hypothetical protein
MVEDSIVSICSNLITTPDWLTQPEALPCMCSFREGTGGMGLDSSASIPTDTLKIEPTVATTSHASYPFPSIADRGRASLALIFQPGYNIIQRGLMPKLSSRDLARLREAALSNTHLLRNLSSHHLPQPQVRCQNNPPLSMVWKGIQGSDWHGWTEQAGPRQPCRRELHTENIGVDLAVCDGYRLGLPTGLQHGNDFLVCHHCESVGKSQLRLVWPSTSIKLVGDLRATAELCADCALDRQVLRPYAECQCERRFENLNLCWDCRVEYPRQWLLDVICEAAASLPVMDPLVEPTGNAWSTLERWVLPPDFEPRSGCLDCGIDYIESAQTWLNLWTANEASGRESRLAYMTTPQAETVCLYCLSPVRLHRQ